MSAAFPSNPETVPPTLKYGLAIVDNLRNMKAAMLTSKSSPTRPPQKFIADLNVSEPAEISEVILYFNDALTPNAMVVAGINRFMSDGAPRFANSAEASPAAD